MNDTKRVYATVEGAKGLMQRLGELGIAAKISVGADGRFDVQPADGKHTCHWPGCGKEVPPAMWGCNIDSWKVKMKNTIFWILAIALVVAVIVWAVAGSIATR